VSTVYTGARVFTAGEPAWADAVAVVGDRIACVGTEADAREAAGPGAEVVELDGGVVLPGFVDGHAHLLMSGAAELRANLHGARDLPRSRAGSGRGQVNTLSRPACWGRDGCTPPCPAVCRPVSCSMRSSRPARGAGGFGLRPLVGADHELRGRVGQVGDVALDPGQRAGLGFQGAVDGFVGADERDEPVALDRYLPGHRLLGLGDLLVDPAQRAPRPIGLVLVVDDLVTPLVGRSGGSELDEDQPVGHRLARVLAPPLLDDVGDLGDLHAEDERQPRSLDRALVARAASESPSASRSPGSDTNRHVLAKPDHRV
jgi:hypothetical protein